MPVKSASVFPVLGGATGTAYFDLIQLMQFSPGPAAVTFMFDDGYKSTKSVAKPTLDKYRLRWFCRRDLQRRGDERQHDRPGSQRSSGGRLGHRLA